MNAKFRGKFGYCGFWLLCCLIIGHEARAGFGLKEVFNNLHSNTTNPGVYEDAAAGYISGGSSVVRTKSTAISPISINPPSINSSCNGIDMYLGSFSMISGDQLVGLAKNIGSQALVYGFHLGLKTYAPLIETTLKDFRNVAMSLNQMGVGNCHTVKAAFAAALPQNSAMYESVCREMAQESGVDLGGQRKKCRDYQSQKVSIAEKQRNDPEALLDNYNLFIKAARAIGIPKDLHASLMSMVGTIVIKDGVGRAYPSMADSGKALDIYINGGDGAKLYSCDNDDCLNINVLKTTISKEAAYAGKVADKLNSLKRKLMEQSEEFSNEEKGFIDSIGDAFPIFNHIMLEAASGVSILTADSKIIARYMLLEHIRQVTKDIKASVYYLKGKQMSGETIKDYLEALNKLENFAEREWNKVMSDADRINDRAIKIEKHMLAATRG
jgi:conjugative transfer pilus assembly protein TraH